MTYKIMRTDTGSRPGISYWGTPYYDYWVSGTKQGGFSLNIWDEDYRRATVFATKKLVQKEISRLMRQKWFYDWHQALYAIPAGMSLERLNDYITYKEFDKEEK